MDLTVEVLEQMTEYTIGRKWATLRFADTREIVAQWPVGRRPKNVTVACEVALRTVRNERTLDLDDVEAA